jgi:hypothetical protein
MSRGLDASNISAVDDVVVRPVVFCEIKYDSPTGTLYFHDNIGDITADDWGGTSRTWSGLGDFGSISQIEEGKDVSPYKVDLILSGIDATIANAHLSDDTILREVYLSIGFIGLDRVVLADPHPMWAGRVDDVQVAVGSQSVIRVSCESQLAAFEKTNGRLQNDADHQAEFSGDLFYKYLPQMVEAKFRWGGKTQRFGTGTAPVGGIGGINTGGILPNVR